MKPYIRPDNQDVTFGLSCSINTISTKLADMQCVPDYKVANELRTECFINSTSGVCIDGCRQFNHPFAQVDLVILLSQRVNRARTNPFQTGSWHVYGGAPLFVSFPLQCFVHIDAY